MSFLKKLFSGKFFAKRRAKRKSQRVAGGGFVPSGVNETAATILLADIEGAGGDNITKYLAAVFGALNEVAAYRRNKPIKLNRKVQLFPALQEAANEGARWLREEGADLLVWGQTVDLGTAVTLRFLPVGAAEGQAGTFEPGDHLTLPIPLPTDLDGLILASGLGALLPVHKGSRKKVADILEKEIKQLDKVWEEPPHLEPPHLASCLTCYGNVCMALVRVGMKAYLDKALQAYQQAVTAVGKEEDVLIWASAQNHFAGALQYKAQRDADDDARAAAAAAYSELADALGRETYPNEWAMAQINMAVVLFKLGNKATTPNQLKEASQAFEDALSVMSKDLNPGRWAEAMNQHGTVLLALGERLQGAKIVEKAVEVFKEALEVRQKEIVPLQWAQTANNLGAACFSLAKRNPDPQLLQDAEKYFTGASEIYQAAGNQKRVVVIKKNLQRVRQAIRSSGVSKATG